MPLLGDKLLFEPQDDGCDDLRLNMVNFAKQFGLTDEEIISLIDHTNAELAFFEMLPEHEKQKALDRTTENVSRILMENPELDDLAPYIDSLPVNKYDIN